MRLLKWFAPLALVGLLGGCASTGALPEVDGSTPIIEEEGAPKQLLACYVVAAYGDIVLYTDSYFFDRTRAIKNRGALEVAADRIRDWPKGETWVNIEARYATAAIAMALDESLKDKVLEYLAGGISVSNFIRLIGRAALKGAVLEAFIDDIKAQENLPEEERIANCIDRIELTEKRLKDLSGLGS
jgi:hypothetical protein